MHVPERVKGFEQAMPGEGSEGERQQEVVHQSAGHFGIPKHGS